MSKRQISEPHIQLAAAKLSPKEGNTVRKSFKWKNLFQSKKSNSADPGPEGDCNKKSQTICLSRSNTSGSPNIVKDQVNLRISKEETVSLKLSTLDEFPDDESIGNQAPKISRKSLDKQPWRNIFTRSFIGHPKKPEEISPKSLNLNLTPRHTRRISVIGDVDCDRRMFAPSPEANEKLDNLLRKQFGEKQLIDPFYTTDEEDDSSRIDESYCSTRAVVGIHRRKRTPNKLSSKTLPRQKRSYGTPIKNVHDPLSNKYANTLKRVNRIQKRRLKKEHLQRRRSWHQNLGDLINLDDPVAILDSKILVEKLARQAISTSDFSNGTLKRKNQKAKRFLSSSAVGDVNKPVLK